MAGSRRIRVFLDGEEIETFRGMKVKHILSRRTLQRVKHGEIVVTDEEGHERGLEGSLSDGEHLKVKPAVKPS